MTARSCLLVSPGVTVFCMMTRPCRSDGLTASVTGMTADVGKLLGDLWQRELDRRQEARWQVEREANRRQRRFLVRRSPFRSLVYCLHAACLSAFIACSSAVLAAPPLTDAHTYCLVLLLLPAAGPDVARGKPKNCTRRRRPSQCSVCMRAAFVAAIFVPPGPTFVLACLPAAWS